MGGVIMADFEIAGFLDSMPEGESKEEKPKRTRQPRKKVPTKKDLISMFKTWFTSMNIAAGFWAGANPLRLVWLLNETEIDMEAEAFAEACLEYPFVLEWLAYGEKATPLGKLLVVQYIVFSMKFRTFNAMKEQQRQEAAKNPPPMPEPGAVNPNGAIPDAFVPGEWMNVPQQ